MDDGRSRSCFVPGVKFTVSDRDERREARIARKRERFSQRTQKDEAANGESEVGEPSSSRAISIPSVADLAAMSDGSTEVVSRRSKVISMMRSKAESAAVAVGISAELPAETEGDRPRLLVGPTLSTKKPRWVMWSAIFAVGLPTLVTAIYFVLFAADQYSSEGRFAVRASEVSGGSGEAGIAMSLGLGGATSTTSDSYIVIEYLQSRRLVEDLQRRLDIRKLFSRPEADFYARLDPTISIEKLVNYWKGMTHAYFDSMSGIVEFRVRAFTPDDAQKISTEALASAERLINDLSKRARDDTVQAAKDDLVRAELRLRLARKGIREFRDKQKQVDPAAITSQRMAVLSSLEQDLATTEASRATVDSFLNSNAPSVRMMQNKIDALRRRIGEERGKLGNSGEAIGDGGEAMSAVIAQYEELETERIFAEKLYETALGSLEAAKVSAERKMRYVASFIEPPRAEDSEYPERLKDTLLVFVSTGLIWAIVVLVVFGVRDQTV